MKTIENTTKPSASKAAKPIVRNAGPKPPSIATRNRERLQAIAGHCHTPVGELHEMFLAAALDAVQPGLEADGLILPLRLTIAEPIVRSAPKPPRKPVKLNVEIDTNIVRAAEKLAKGTGESFDQLLARAVRELAEQPEMLPIYFPADDVRLLREICEAEGSQSGDDLAREMIASIAKESLGSDTGRAPHLAFGVLEAQSDFDDMGNPEFDLAALERMQAVVDRWNGKAC